MFQRLAELAGAEAIAVNLPDDAAFAIHDAQLEQVLESGGGGQVTETEIAR